MGYTCKQQVELFRRGLQLAEIAPLSLLRGGAVRLGRSERIGRRLLLTDAQLRQLPLQTTQFQHTGHHTIRRVPVGNVDLNSAGGHEFCPLHPSPENCQSLRQWL